MKWLDRATDWINETYASASNQITNQQFATFHAVDTLINGYAGYQDVNAEPEVQLAQQSEMTLYARNQLFDKIDLISNLWIPSAIKEIILSDGFNDLTGKDAVAMIYQDDDDKEKQERYTKDLQELCKRTDLLEILSDCLANEGIDYGEQFLSTPVRPGMGIIKVVDDMDVREHLALYKNARFIGALKFELGGGKKAQSKEFVDSKDISHFMLAYKKMPVKIFDGFEKSYDIPEKIRCAQPILAPVIDQILQYNQLEAIQMALALMDATKPVVLGVGVNPDNDVTEITKQLQQYTNSLNMNKNNIVNNLEGLDEQTILKYAHNIQLVPFGVDDGTNLMKQVKVDYDKDDLNQQLNDKVRSIARGVGIPDQYLALLLNNSTKDSKEDSLLTNPRYRGKLSKIQNLLGKGLKDTGYKHLYYKYMNENGTVTRKIDRDKIKVIFKATTTLNDRLEKEEMLLNAETLGNLVNVVDNIASSPNIALKVQEDEFLELWKDQNAKYIKVRNLFRKLTPEEQEQFDAMNNIDINGQYSSDLQTGQDDHAVGNSQTEIKQIPQKDKQQTDSLESEETGETIKDADETKQTKNIKHTEIKQMFK